MALTSDFINLYRLETISLMEQKLTGYKNIIYPNKQLILNTDNINYVEPVYLIAQRFESKEAYNDAIKKLLDELAQQNSKSPTSVFDESLVRTDGETKEEELLFYYVYTNIAIHLIDEEGLNIITGGISK